MTRDVLTTYIKKEYKVIGDRPFSGDFETTVFRHGDNRKWFALLMRISGDKLGLLPKELDVVNVKVEPDMAAALVGSGGIYEAYHMNKKHWITVALDGTASDENVKALVDISFRLTAPKKKSGR